MPYSELVKDFGKVRDLMREFYLYGFKKRSEYTSMSARTYDDERRRLESWLGGCMRFERTPEGKNVFLSVNTRSAKENPLYAAWKARSFTDGDITLHFILFDILPDPGTALTLREIMAAIDLKQAGFEEAKMFDESTVRKKLQEYIREGIITAEKKGRELRYRRADAPGNMDGDALRFFSETAPCGVIGSFLQDKEEKRESPFTFKHHYITGALDQGILCALFEAMGEKRQTALRVINRRRERVTEKDAVPLRLLISVQSGRMYLMAWVPRFKRLMTFRTDNILSVRPGAVREDFDALRGMMDRLMAHMWGVSLPDEADKGLTTVTFTVRYADHEQFVHERLEREKRCGTVEKLDKNTSRFTAEVIDALEMFPWIRTFTGRIGSIRFSDPALQARFIGDLEDSAALYGIEGA